MAEYKEFHCPHGDDFEGGDECDRCEQYELCMETPTADVVERKTYEQMVQMFKQEHESWSNLCSKIDKAIEEIENSFEPTIGTYNGDTPEYDRPFSRFNRNEGKKQALEILKRNIGK
jgi:hypothetical protein